jgi:glutamate racemase
MLDAKIDCLVLGCTHYHFLTPILKQLLPSYVKIIESGKAVARQTKSILISNALLNTVASKEPNRFYTNGTVAVVDSLLKSETALIKKIEF